MGPKRSSDVTKNTGTMDNLTLGNGAMSCIAKILSSNLHLQQDDLIFSASLRALTTQNRLLDFATVLVTPEWSSS